MKDRIKRLFGCSLLCGLLLSALPLSTAAAQIPVKENIDSYDIAPDLCPSGKEEELDNVTFHSVLLPEELKDNGITIALPVPGKGKVHYSLGVDSVYSAAIIQPEVSEDAEGKVPVTNHYESDEVYDYYYNFDTSHKGTYYVRITAPDDTEDEDIAIRFSAQFYDGDRSIRYELSDNNGHPGDVPKTGEGNEAWLYYGMAALCFGLLILMRIKDADKTDTDYR